MKDFRLLDLLFGIITIASFALMATVLFGRAFSESSFWIQFLPVLGAVLIMGYLRRPLSALALAPRMIAWFSIGFTAATFLTVAGAAEFSPAFGSAFGLVLALVNFLSERRGCEGLVEDH